jgi:hypothetical protein
MHLLYIDPGIGTILAQIIIGGFLSVLFFFRQIKNRVLNIFRSTPPSDSSSDSKNP